MAQEDLVGTQLSMGHEDIKTTMLYVHPDDRKVRVASAQWSALLRRDEQVDVTNLAPEPTRALRSTENG